MLHLLTKEYQMKAFVSALALGFVVALSAPAFAGTGNAYVGDQITGPAPPKATEKSAENDRVMKRRGLFRRRHVE
jgi:hypothetical protein